MTPRDVLERRLRTLGTLLEAPGGPLGPGGGSIGERLRSGWETERRLLERLLGDDPAADPVETVALWRERTLALVARAGDGASWTDRHGRQWTAARVLELLDETDERIAPWRATEGGELGGSSGAGEPSGGRERPPAVEPTGAGSPRTHDDAGDAGKTGGPWPASSAAGGLS